MGAAPIDLDTRPASERSVCGEAPREGDVEETSGFPGSRVAWRDQRLPRPWYPVPDRGREASPRLLPIVAALLVVTFVAYWPVKDNAFVQLDDYDYVSRNPVVLKGLTADGVEWAFSTFTLANWHPLTWLSHMLDCDLFRVQAAGGAASNGPAGIT